MAIHQFKPDRYCPTSALPNATDMSSPKFARHDEHVDAVMAHGGFAALSTRPDGSVCLPLVYPRPVLRLAAPEPLYEPPTPTARPRVDRSVKFVRREGEFAPSRMVRIATSVGRKHKVHLDDMRGARVFRKLSYARHEAMYLIYQSGVFSLPQIGKFFGGRDHTTISAGIEGHAERSGLPSLRRDAVKA